MVPPHPRGQINNWIMQALGILGFPASFAGGIFEQIMTESSGNPGAVQQVQDVNSGPNRALGIMQVIPTTFASYVLPGHGNEFNPVDNIIAGARYAMANYGAGWFNVGDWHHHGYDSGGILPPGVTMAVNNTGEDEFVLTRSQMGGATVNNFNLNMNNTHLLSSGAMDEFIDRLGSRLATWTLPAAGVRINR